MFRRFLLAFVIISSLALLGCLCPCLKGPPTGVIEGYVTNHLSGEAVVGATVRAWPLDGEAPRYTVISDYYKATAVTDSEGYYRLVVPEGLYVVEVRKEGHATSRVEGVKVGSSTTTPTPLHIVLKPVFNPGWPVEPPKVTVSGVTEGMTITGPIDVRIDASGPNDIQLIYAAFGKMPGARFHTHPRVIYYDTYTTGEFSIDPATYGVSGNTTFEVVVYDQNDNRTHVIYRVFVTPAAAPATIAAPLPPEPPTPMALAVTLSKQLGFFGAPLDPQAAPPGGNLYVELRWRRSPDDPDNVTGYRIYRRLAGETEFRLLYTVQATGAWTYLYRDSTPDLAVGVTATYRITAYKGTVESEPIEASTTPLPPWDVRLVSPADGATEVDLLPTFTWEPTALVGTTQRYRVWVLDTAHGAPRYVVSGFLDNVTSWTFTGIPRTPYERLQPHRMYQWGIDLAIAYDDVTNPTAVSVAVNDYVLWAYPVQKPKELFTFTTRDW